MIEVPLRDRTGTVIATALLDAEDAELADVRWHLHPGGYAMRKPGGVTTLMHREVLKRVLGHDDFECADHLNHDRLDNRRSNLEATTLALNSARKGTRVERVVDPAAWPVQLHYVPALPAPVTPPERLKYGRRRPIRAVVLSAPAGRMEGTGG